MFVAQPSARRAIALLSTIGALLLSPNGSPSVAHAATQVPITGAGSTWSSNAMDQWIGDVDQYGIKVDFAATGSSDGRTQFKNGTVDFGVSEIPYGVTDNGTYEPPPSRAYAYMPIVAGGTSFMYQLHINGQQVTNLRLSGATIAGIFTGNITKWNDPAVVADNPGIVMPAEPIVPVVRSDGSGTTAQLTTWMSKKYPDVWNAYCGKAGRVTPCGVTSTYPTVSGYGFITQQLSTGVAGYITQSQSEGTIGYVEASYAIQQNYPVAKVLNTAGFYAEPTANNVAVALTAAQINTDPSSPNYLTQVLDGVYANPDSRAYPLSSYSYMIIPTTLQAPMTSDKGYTLGKFAYYFLCEGQQKMADLGYSPLPNNLVQAAVDQVKKIPGVDVESIDLSKCNNPTFDPTGKNLLAVNAPMPKPCDKQGVTMCPDGTGGADQPTYVAPAGVGQTAAPTTTAPPAVTTKPGKPASGKPAAKTSAGPGGARPTGAGSTAGPAGGTATPPAKSTGRPSASTTGAAGRTDAGPTGASGPLARQPAPGALASATSPPGTGPLTQATPPPDITGDGPAAPPPAVGAVNGSGSAVVAPEDPGTGTAAVAPLRAVPVALAVGSGWTFQDTLMVLALVLFGLVVTVPPVLSRRLARKAP